MTARADTDTVRYQGYSHLVIVTGDLIAPAAQAQFFKTFAAARAFARATFNTGGRRAVLYKIDDTGDLIVTGVFLAPADVEAAPEAPSPSAAAALAVAAAYSGGPR